MELKFEKTSCRCLRRIAWEVQNLEQTQEVRLPDGLPDIGRVLCAWGQVILRSKEWRGDGMGASGGVMVWVLYAPDDGSEPQWVDTWLSFQAKWNFQETEREGMIRLVPLLRSVDARTVSARKMMVRAGIGILGEAVEPYEAEICCLGELPEGVELLRHTYPMKLPREAGEKSFLLDEELTLPASCPAAEKILRFEMLPQLQDSKVMAGKMVFRGNGLLHVLYRGQNGEMAGWDFEIPFSQFGELEGEFGPDAAARTAIAVTSLELELTEERTLRLKCGLVAQYVVSDQVLLELAEDAYSPRREVVPSFQELMLPAVLDERSEMLCGEVVLDIECTRIVDISFLPDHPRVSRMGDQNNGELSGVFQILYEDNGGSLQCVARRWEQQWGFDADGDSRVVLDIVQDGMPSATASGGSVTLKSNVNVITRVDKEQGQLMLSGVDVGEVKQPDQNRPSLILRRAEGERLWDLAKSCGTTVAAICQANQLQTEPMEGQMLLIPVI